MKILIVGAGIAGLTLAALLRQRGVDPKVIERSPSLNGSEYMLGIYPTGANVLHGLQVYPDYLASSAPASFYEAYTDGVQLLKKFSFAPITEKFGPYQFISHSDLLAILLQGTRGLQVEFNTEIESLMQNVNEVVVKLNNGEEEEFDLVVGADGLHSHVRTLILEKKDYSYFDTHWGCWVWCGPLGLVPTHTIQEFWGMGSFWGMYPLKNKTAILAAVHHPSAEDALKNMPRSEFIAQKFAPLKNCKPELFLQLPRDEEELCYWQLSDQKAKKWSQGRVVLIGDAATAFLPTAGIGASMALESAAVLNDILTRTNSDFLTHGLSLFEKRRKNRVERAQKHSRQLAKIMFVDSIFGSWCRDSLTKLMSVESLIKSIVRGFDEPI